MRRLRTTTTLITATQPPVTPAKRGLVLSCQICNKKFGTFLKEHQCKRCNRAVCDNCSKSKAKVIGYDIKPNVSHRICSVCKEESEYQMDFRTKNTLTFGVQSEIGDRWCQSLSCCDELVNVDSSYQEGNIDLITSSNTRRNLNFSIMEFVHYVCAQEKDERITNVLKSTLTKLCAKMRWSSVPPKIDSLCIFLLCFCKEDSTVLLIEAIVKQLLPDFAREFLSSNNIEAIPQSSTWTKAASDLMKTCNQIFAFPSEEAKAVSNFIDKEAQFMLSTLLIENINFQVFFWIFNTILIEQSMEKSFIVLIQLNLNSIKNSSSDLKNEILRTTRLFEVRRAGADIDSRYQSCPFLITPKSKQLPEIDHLRLENSSLKEQLTVVMPQEIDRLISQITSLEAENAILSAHISLKGSIAEQGGFEEESIESSTSNGNDLDISQLQESINKAVSTHARKLNLQGGRLIPSQKETKSEQDSVNDSNNKTTKSSCESLGNAYDQLIDRHKQELAQIQLTHSEHQFQQEQIYSSEIANLKASIQEYQIEIEQLQTTISQKTTQFTSLKELYDQIKSEKRDQSLSKVLEEQKQSLTLTFETKIQVKEQDLKNEFQREKQSVMESMQLEKEKEMKTQREELIRTFEKDKQSLVESVKRDCEINVKKSIEFLDQSIKQLSNRISQDLNAQRLNLSLSSSTLEDYLQFTVKLLGEFSTKCSKKPILTPLNCIGDQLEPVIEFLPQESQITSMEALNLQNISAISICESQSEREFMRNGNSITRVSSIGSLSTPNTKNFNQIKRVSFEGTHKSVEQIHRIQILEQKNKTLQENLSVLKEVGKINVELQQLLKQKEEKLQKQKESIREIEGTLAKKFAESTSHLNQAKDFNQFDEFLNVINQYDLTNWARLDQDYDLKLKNIQEKFPQERVKRILNTIRDLLLALREEKNARKCDFGVLQNQLKRAQEKCEKLILENMEIHSILIDNQIDASPNKQLLDDFQISNDDSIISQKHTSKQSISIINSNINVHETAVHQTRKTTENNEIGLTHKMSCNSSDCSIF